jgi:methylmalonyl-CoA mutase
MLQQLHNTWPEESKEALRKVQLAAIKNQNIFQELMEAVKYCSLGQITQNLFEVGGQYRRNM